MITITLLKTLALAFLVIAPVVDANGPQHIREHARLIRRRGPAPPLRRQIFNPRPESSSSTQGPSSVPPSSAPPTSTAPATTTTRRGGLIDDILNPGPPTSSTPSITPASSSAPPPTSAPPTSAPPSSTPPTSTPVSSTPRPSSARPTTTQSESPEESGDAAGQTDDDDNDTGGPATLSRNTIYILVAIGASVAVAGIIWAIIRQWKLRPSREFERRVEPIDWQAPLDDTPGAARLGAGAAIGGAALARSGSNGSDRSFASGDQHQMSERYGGGAGTGAGAAGRNMYASDSLAPDFPPAHDFTAGSANAYPAGGYGYGPTADPYGGMRGHSPQPGYNTGYGGYAQQPYDTNYRY